jgi:hypothetical protein
MPMQSAARVPILVSFIVEEYPGPDNDPLLQHTTLKNSILQNGVENDKDKINHL